MDDVWHVYDQRGIMDPEEATVLAVGASRDEAIEDCRDQGGGCVYTPDGHLTFWLDGDVEWDAYKDGDSAAPARTKETT